MTEEVHPPAPTPASIQVPAGKWWVMLNGVQVATLDGPLEAVFSLQWAIQQEPKLEGDDA